MRKQCVPGVSPPHSQTPGYTLFAHVLISKPISKNLWKIGYSGNLLCNSDVTSLKFLLPQVAFSIMASTTFRGSTFSDAVSLALKQLQMSHVSLKPEQRSSMETIYDGHDPFMWLPTGYGLVFPSSTIPHGIQAGSRRHYKLDYCLDKPSVKRCTQLFSRSLFHCVSIAFCL